MLRRSVCCILEGVRHDIRGCQIPEVDFFVEVTAHQDVDIAIGVVIEQTRRVGVHPLWQIRCRGYIGERLPLITDKELCYSPFVDKKVIPAIIVDVAPQRAHRDARACFIDIRDA